MSELDKAARGGGWLVFNGKKYTCYAIATCAAKLLQAVFSDAKLACPASVYLEDYGCYVEINKAKNLAQRDPSEKEVTKWIEEAGKLEAKITY